MVRWLYRMLAICALVGLTACTTLPHANARPPCNPGHTMQITPLDVPPDDVASILQMHRWKFRIVIPAAPENCSDAATAQAMIDFRYTVELRQGGHDPILLVNQTVGSIFPLGEPGSELLVALFPFDRLGTSAAEMKLYLNGAVYVTDNPTTGQYGARVSSPAALQPDGSFRLMEMGTNERKNIFPSPDNRQLVFSLTRVDRP